MSKDYDIDILRQILRKRKDKRYRAGLVDGARMLGVISQRQWVVLTFIYVKRRKR